MNICLLTSTFLPEVGGLEIVVHNLASALSELGHNVYIVTPFRKRFRNIIDIDVYKVIRFGFRGSRRLKLSSAIAMLTLSSVVKRYNIDVINAHNVYSAGSWSYLFSRLNKRIPIVGTPHGDDIQITPEIHDGRRLNPKYDRIVRRNLAAFNCITAISPSIRQDLYEIVDNRDNIFDVPNGVWVEQIQKDVDSTAIREKFNIPQDSIAIISIGRNHPRKGFEYGLNAIAKLKKEGYPVSYILVGRGMDAIIDKSRALSVADCLITPGQVESEMVSALLHASDIYFSPSIVESFGVATLEAMSVGLPCVVTDIAGSRDLVSSDYGMLVKSKDSDKMSEALKYLIDHSSVRREMGIQSKIEANQYDWPNVAKKYINVYREASDF